MQKAKQVEETTERKLFLNRLDDLYIKALLEKEDYRLAYDVACKRFEVAGVEENVKGVRALLEGLAKD